MCGVFFAVTVGMLVSTLVDSTRTTEAGPLQAHRLIPARPYRLIIVRYESGVSGSIFPVRTVDVREQQKVTEVALIIDNLKLLPQNYGLFCGTYHVSWHDVLTFEYRDGRRLIVISQTVCPPIVYVQSVARGPKYGGEHQHQLLVRYINTLVGG